jgi:hypothetical protein
MTILYFLEPFSAQKISEEIWPQIYLGQDPVIGRFRKSDPAPVKNRPDPQHCPVL